MRKSLIYGNYKVCMFIGTALLLVTTACTFFSAQYLAKFLNAVSNMFKQGGESLFLKIGLVLLIQLIIDFFRNTHWKGYRAKLTNNLECLIYDEYLHASTKLSTESELSVVYEKDIKESETFCTETLPHIIQALIGIVLYTFFFLSKKDGIVLLVILLFLGLFQFLPPIIVQKYLIQNYIRAGQEEANIRQHLLAGLQGITTIKMLNLEKWFVDAFCSKQRIFQKTGERAAATSSVQSALTSGVSLLQQLGLLIIGIGGVAWNWISLETLIEGYILSSSFYQYCASLGAFKAKYGIYKAAKKRIAAICEVTNQYLKIESCSGKITLPEAGCWLIRGKNGAGKSTFLALLRGNHSDDKTIVWKNQKLDRENRKRITSWCPQQYLQLSDSFRTLVELVPEGMLDQDKLQECILRFSVDKALMDRPINQLSGGEQKKLMISLTLAKKSDILLLDEPEVSLDHASILVLKELLCEENRLVLIVTHNPIFDEISKGAIFVKEGVVNV